MSSKVECAVPLIRQALTDSNFKISKRNISAEWNYRSIIPASLAGFNPLYGASFTPQDSVLSQWLKNKKQPIRKLNESDLLVRELFLAAHDYLHAWAYRAINEIMPKLKFGYGEITNETFEDFVFCHLLTETVATIGVDYWYLSQVNINQILDLGSKFSTLTANYHEKYADEYRSFNPKMDANRPDFFKKLNDFYCTGIFPGFTISDLLKSPLTLSWLQHEISYGETQREYSRRWLAYLAGRKINLTPNQLSAPVRCDQPWQKKLTEILGQLLWDKIQKDKQHSFTFEFDPEQIWQNSKDMPLDFHFTNLTTLNPKTSATQILQNAYPDENFKIFFQQYVCSFDFHRFDKELIKLFDFLVQKKDFDLIQYLFRDEVRVGRGLREPTNLFFLN